MTLILITREPGKIICYSDSRVTHRPNEKISTITDHFSKLLVLQYRATLGKMSDPTLKEVRGEFGFAFAGDILFATALYSMASNIFANLHDEKATEPPSIEEFADMCTRLANILLDDDIFNARQRKYTVLFFGPCPQSKELEIFEISVSEESSPGCFRYLKVGIQDTGFQLVGSGAGSFLQHVKTHPHLASTAPYAEILLDTINERSDPSIGGTLQQCVATADGVQIVPIIHPINDGENLDIHISGLSTKHLGTIGTFGVGRDAIGFRVLDVLATQWLMANGFEKHRDKNEDYVNETAKLMANLQHWQSSEEPSAGIHGFVKFCSPKAIDTSKYYFFGRCVKCDRPSPILQDPSNGKKPNPFFGKGGIVGSCTYCGVEVRVAVSKIKCKPGK